MRRVSRVVDISSSEAQEIAEDLARKLASVGGGGGYWVASPDSAPEGFDVGFAFKVPFPR